MVRTWGDVVKLKGIDSDTLYCLKDAVKFLPSNVGGRKPHVAALYRWHKEGRLPLVLRKTSRNRNYFVLGSDLEALFVRQTSPPQEKESDPALLPDDLHAAEVQHRATQATLWRDHGLKTPNLDGTMPEFPARPAKGGKKPKPKEGRKR